MAWKNRGAEIGPRFPSRGARLWLLVLAAWSLALSAPASRCAASGRLASTLGAPHFRSASAVADSFRDGPVESRALFSSKEWEPAAGLAYCGYRFYNPGLGRWTSRDPLGETADPAHSLYRFIGNNPLNAVDPFGLELFPSWGPPGGIFGAQFGDIGGVPAAVGEVAGDVWNSPNTAVGLVLGGAGLLAGGTPPYRDNGALVFENNPAAGCFPIMAIVLGGTTHYAPGYGPGTPVYSRYDGQPTHFLLRDHERRHIPQERFFGPTFIPLYLFLELYPGVNPFENDADNAAERKNRKKCEK